MIKNKFEQPHQPEKEKREMIDSELEEMGEEMEEYFLGLQEQAEEIKKELTEPGISQETREELNENLKLILEQLGEDWQGFVDDIKSGDWSEAKIDKD